MKSTFKMSIISALLLLTACSAMKDMDSMSKTTSDMAGTTKTMSDTTTHLSGTSDSTLQAVQATGVIAQDTDGNVKSSLVEEETMYSDGRVAAAAQSRSDAIKDMNASPDIAGKIAHAGCYFQGFEYQSWKNVNGDTQAELDILYLTAMKEFTRVLGNYLPNNDFSKTDASSTSAQNMDLYALAAASQEIYENALPGTLSVLDLVEQTLKMNQSVNNTKGAEANLKDWQREILNNYPQLVYFLRVRTSFLAAMTLGKISKIEELEKDKFYSGFPELLKDEHFEWKMDFANLNLERIAMTTQWMNAANTTATYLESINEHVNVDKNIKELMSKMQMVDTASPKVIDQARTDAIGTFKSAIEGFESIKE